jgi:hypothetical protein
MLANRELLSIVAVSILGIAILLTTVVGVLWYIAYVHATRTYIGKGDYETWKEFVKRASTRTGLVVLVLTLMGAQAAALLVIVRSQSLITLSALTTGTITGVVISLLLTTCFLANTRWSVLRRGQHIIESLTRQGESAPDQSQTED